MENIIKKDHRYRACEYVKWKEFVLDMTQWRVLMLVVLTLGFSNRRERERESHFMPILQVTTFNEVFSISLIRNVLYRKQRFARSFNQNILYHKQFREPVVALLQQYVLTSKFHGRYAILYYTKEDRIALSVRLCEICYQSP
jgi:hypothetical protein